MVVLYLLQRCPVSQGSTLTLVLRVGVSLTSYSIVQREPVLRGEGPRFVGRKCALAPSLRAFFSASKHGGLVCIAAHWS